VVPHPNSAAIRAIVIRSSMYIRRKASAQTDARVTHCLTMSRASVDVNVHQLRRFVHQLRRFPGASGGALLALVSHDAVA
jgi:hypothetical protein